MSPRENLLAAIRHQIPEWVPCPIVDGSWRVVCHALRERPPGDGTDDWGVYWELRDAQGGTFPARHPLKDLKDIGQYPFPDPEAGELMEPAREAIRRLDRDRCLVFGDNGWGIFERAWMLVGMENLLVAMIEQPDVVSALLARICDIKARITERLTDEVGVDGIMYGDDWGSDTSLIMSPALWRTFLKPHQRRLYGTCRQRGVLVQQHSDGRIESIVPDLVETGLDILNPVQPECNDVVRIKNGYGKALALHGAVSSRAMDSADPSVISEEVRVRISQLSAGGGYILSPAHSMPYPQANMEAFRQAAVRFGEIPGRWVLPTQRTGRTDIEV